MEPQAVLCRLDGYIHGVYGPLSVPVDRKCIAQVMGWEDSGKAVEVIDKTMTLLQEGKAVRLTSHTLTVYYNITPGFPFRKDGEAMDIAGRYPNATGGCLPTMTRELTFTFPTEEKAELAKKKFLEAGFGVNDQVFSRRSGLQHRPTLTHSCNRSATLSLFQDATIAPSNFH